MKPSEALKKVVTIIEENGWTQDNFINDDGSVCWLGAVNRVYFSNYEVCLIMRQAMQKEVGAGIITWNDDPTTTKELVIRTTLKVAADLEAEGN